MQDALHTPAPATKPPRRARRLRRLLLIPLLPVLLLLALAGGGLTWLCGAAGQDWLRATLNEALAPMLAEQGLRLRIERLEGLPFAVRLAVRGEDDAGLWLDAPDLRLDWKLDWQDGLVLRMERLALYGGGLYRLPHMSASPPEEGPALTPGEQIDDIARSVGDVLALVGRLPAALPRLDGRVVLDAVALPPQWLALLPPEDSEAAPALGTMEMPLPAEAFPRVSLEMPLRAALGEQAAVRAELRIDVLWPHEAAPLPTPPDAAESTARPQPAPATADDRATVTASGDRAPAVSPPASDAPAALALPEALLPLFGSGEAQARLELRAERRADGGWGLNLPQLAVTAGMARLSGSLALVLDQDAARWWENPLELTLDLALDPAATPAPRAQAWERFLSGPASAGLRLSGPLGAPVLSLTAEGAGLLPPAEAAAPVAATPPAAPAAKPVSLSLRAPRLRLEARPLRWRATLDGGTTRLALHAESRCEELPLRADILLAAGLRREEGEDFWRISLEDIFAAGAGIRLTGIWGLDLALDDMPSGPEHPATPLPAPDPASSPLPAEHAAAAATAATGVMSASGALAADDIISRQIAAVVHLLPPMRGQLDLGIADWRELGRLGALVLPDLRGEGQPARLVLRASGREAPEAFARRWGVTDWHVTLDAPQAQLRNKAASLLHWRDLRVRADLAPRVAAPAPGDGFGPGNGSGPDAPVLAADLRAERLELPSLRLVRPHVSLNGPLSGPLDLTATADGDLRADIKLRWQPGTLHLERLRAALPAHKVGLHLQRGGTLRYSASGLNCDPLRILFTPAGELQLEGSLAADALRARLRLAKTPLAPWQAVLPALPDGAVALDARLQGRPEKPQGTFALDVTDLHMPGTPLPPLNVALSGGIRQAGTGGEGFLALNLPAESRRLLGAEAVEGRVSLPLIFSGGLPLPAPRAALKGSFRWQGAAAPLWNLVPLADRRLSGKLDVRADLSGTTDAPALAGSVSLNDGRFEDVALGVLLTDMRLRAALDRSVLSGLKGLGRIRLDASLGDGRTGRASLDGELSPGGGSLRLAGRLDKLRPLRRRDVTIELSGTASASGPLTSPNVQADIGIDSGEVRIDRLRTTGSITTLPISETAVAPRAAAPRQRPAVGRLNARVHTTGRFVVRGRGLESRWSADIRATGPLTDPRVLGTVEAVEGSFNFLNAKFNLYRGLVRFAGGSPSNPLLDVVLRHEAADIVADVRLGGTAQQPKFQLTSTPTMPQEEIISRVMFGRASNDLGRFENLRLAAAVAELAGFGGGGLSVLDVARKSLGVDVLRVGTRPGSADNGDEEAESTLEAGKFIGEKLYLGVAQGLKPDSTAVVIELQMTPHSKAEVRTEQNNTSAGVRWKINY